MSGSDVISHPAYGTEQGRSDPGRPSRGLSLARLAGRQLRLQGAWAAATALGLALAVALASALPVAAAMATDAALHASLASLGRDAPVTVAQRQVPNPSAFESFEALAGRTVEGRLGPYIASSSALATLGPLTPVSLNEKPAPAQVDSSRLAVGYLRDLADRVEMVAGSVPADGLGGSADIAATMSQAEGDSLGLHLGDRLCLDFAAGGARWCVRVAGLWRPLAGDPFRLEAGRQVELVVGRFDFYRLMRLAASPVATVARQFNIDVGSVDSRDAGDLVSGLKDLRRYFSGRGQLFDTSLDPMIERFDARQHSHRIAAELLCASLAFLVLYQATFLGGRFLRHQERQVTLIRARGWPRRRIKRLLTLQLGALVAVSLILGIVVTVGLSAAVGPALFAVSPPWPDAADRLALVLPAAAGAVLLAFWILISRMAGRAARGGAEERPWNRPQSPTQRRLPRMAGTGLPVAAGLAVLGAVRLLEWPPAWLSPYLPTMAAARLDWLSVVLALGAVLLLCLAGARTLWLAAWLAAGLGRGVPGSLAGWQLGRRPSQHSRLAFLLTAAVAVATFGCVAAAEGPRPEPSPALIAVLLAGAGAALVMALIGLALHFRAVATERAEEYATLMLSGLPRRSLRRSIAVEQATVTWHSLGFGLLIGVGLSAALLPLDASTDDLAAGALLGCLLVGYLAAVLVTGWLVRTGLGRLAPSKQSRVPL